MAVPKRRKSKSRVRTKRAHHALSAVTLIQCPNPKCGEMMKPHHVCDACGFYKGKEIIKT